MSTRSLVGLGMVAAVTLGLWWSRTEIRSAPTLVLRRVAPTGEVLRGPPNQAVEVELELTNPTARLIELAPLSMSCSCQITRAPDTSLAAGTATTVLLSLRFPPAQRSLIPVEFKSRDGELLARTEVVLEVDRTVPYFVHCPDLVEIPIIEGVSAPTWSTSVSLVELTDAPPHVTRVRVTAGAEFARVEFSPAENSTSGVAECQRTYQVTFTLLDAVLASPEAGQPLRGLITLTMRDGTERSIPWTVTRKAPLALLFDARSGTVRGVRRAGAAGEVTLRCLPEGSGTLSPVFFRAGQPILATLAAGPTKPQAVEARYQGAAAIRVSVPIP